MFQHILREEGIKVDQGIEVGVGEVHGFNKGLRIQGSLNYKCLGDTTSCTCMVKFEGISPCNGA